MDRKQTAAVLHANAEEIRALGVKRLALFGSQLRGDARADSDIDLLVDFDREHALSLIDVAKLRLRLSDLLGHPVDLVQRDHLKTHLRDAILAEAQDIL